MSEETGKMDIVKEVFKKIFEPKVGMRVKIVQITEKSRLENFPKLTEFIGKEGTIVRKKDAYLKKGVWRIPAEPGLGRRTKAFLVRFSELPFYNTYGYFELDDLEVV